MVKYCTHCGAPVPEGAEICPDCGHPVEHWAPAGPAASASEAPVPPERPAGPGAQAPTPPAGAEAQGAQTGSPEAGPPFVGSQHEQQHAAGAPGQGQPQPAYVQGPRYQPVGGWNSPAPGAPSPLASEPPLTLGSALVALVISLIPIAGWVVLLIWAFGHGESIARRNLSRALLIFKLIQWVLSVIMINLALAGLSDLIEMMFSYRYYY